jgi:DNA repair protein RecO (recombination protein O)
MGRERQERLYRVDAIVLKRKDMGEADRLLTCFTRDRGKLTLIAKGIRKPASRKAGHLELFTHARYLVARARTWDLITQVETVNVYLPLREDLVRTSYAYYCAELLDRLTEEQDAQAEMFDLFLETMSRLCQAVEPRIPTRYYELRLLDLAGFRPELFTCLGCGKQIQPETNYFHYGQGGILCEACGVEAAGSRRVSVPALKVLRYMQTRPYPAVEGLQLREVVHAEVEDILYHYLTYVLEQNLKSVRFLRTLRDQIRDMGEPASRGTSCRAVQLAGGDDATREATR